MKSRTVILVLCFAVVITGFFLVGNNYLDARQVKKDTYSDITTALQELAALPPHDETTIERREEAERRLADAYAMLPETLNTSAVIDILLKTADHENVDAIPLRSMPWQTLIIDDVSIAGFELLIEVTGTYNDLQQFLIAVGDKLPSLVYTSLSVDTITDDDGAATGQVFAQVAMTCYARGETSGSDKEA